MSDFYNKYKVRLVPMTAFRAGAPEDVRSAQVAFDVTPQFSETRSAEYTPITPVHMPGSIQVYKHTNSRNFEIGATLISRNVADAWKNMENLQKLRSWLLPYFGATSTLTEFNHAARQDRRNGRVNENQTAEERIASEGLELRGAPPDVLYLYAYSSDNNDDRGGSFERRRVNINRIPVVMTNLNITYPDDVDYIPVWDPSNPLGPDGYTEPFPVKISVNLSLVETHSPREYERFNLAAFKNGTLANF